MEEIRLTTQHVWNPANNGKFTISTGAGFLPSTVCQEISATAPHGHTKHGSLPSVLVARQVNRRTHGTYLGHSKQRPLSESKPVCWPSQMQSVQHSNIKTYSNCYTINILIPIMSNLSRLHVSPPISNRSGCTRISINPPSQDWKSE